MYFVKITDTRHGGDDEIRNGLDPLVNEIKCEQRWEGNAITNGLVGCFIPHGDVGNIFGVLYGGKACLGGIICRGCLEMGLFVDLGGVSNLIRAN